MTIEIAKTNPKVGPKLYQVAEDRLDHMLWKQISQRLGIHLFNVIRRPLYNPLHHHVK